MHIICIGRESNHKGRTHPKRGCLSYILYSSTLLISIRNNKRNDPFRADVNWNFTLYSWPPLLLLYFFFSFISFHLARQCVFLVVFFFSTAFVSFSFFAIAFSSPLTTIQQTIRGGKGRKIRGKLCVEYYILAGTDSARKHTWARNVNDVYPSTSIVYICAFKLSSCSLLSLSFLYYYSPCWTHCFPITLQTNGQVKTQ